MSSFIWRFLAGCSGVLLFLLSGLVEIPLVVGSASGLGGSTSLSHMVPRTCLGPVLSVLFLHAPSGVH